MAESLPTLAALSVGNTNLSLGLIDRGKVSSVRGMPVGAVEELVSAIVEAGVDAVALASVNNDAVTKITDALHKRSDATVYRIGRDIPIPMAHALTDEAIAKTGQDRLLAAFGAFQVVEQACVVVDAGTAITVDFVDGEGTFHGGAIAPGASMQLRALSEGTVALPMIAPEKPVGRAIGTDTFGAMQRGMYYGIRGMVRLLTEQYAEEYEAYPLLIATGGDARMLFEDDELIDRIVPDLVLAGIAKCCDLALGGGDGVLRLNNGRTGD
ncbi:MAG: type III pantothenate kinase [Phycisphaerales bacterium]